MALDLAVMGILQAENARDHALDVGVDRGRLLAEGDRGDCGRGVGAEPGSLRSSAAVVGNPPRFADFAGAGNEVPGPRIIAEAGPFREDLLVARRRQRLDSRPAGKEALEPRLTVATVVCCNITSLSQTT